MLRSVFVLYCPVIAVTICCVVAMQGAGEFAGLRRPLDQEWCHACGQMTYMRRGECKNKDCEQYYVARRAKKDQLMAQLQDDADWGTAALEDRRRQNAALELSRGRAALENLVSGSLGGGRLGAGREDGQ